MLMCVELLVLSSDHEAFQYVVDSREEVFLVYSYQPEIWLPATSKVHGFKLSLRCIVDFTT